MKLSTAYQKYLVNLEERMCKPVHIRTVRSRLKPFLQERDGDDLEDVSRRQIARHLAALEDGRSEATMAGYTSTHKAFWRWLYQAGHLDEDLADRLKTRDYDPQVRQPAPEEHVQVVVDALPDFVDHRQRQPRDVRDALAVSLSIDAGARRGTMLNLRRADVDDALARPHWTREGRAVYSAKARGKTGATTVVWFAETADLFTMWLDMIPGRSPYIFVSLRTLQRLRPDSLSRAFVRVCNFAGVPVFRSHAVRKRNTDRIIRLADLEVGQRYAGHSQLSTTAKFYRSLSHRDVYDAAAALAAQRRDDAGFAEDAARFFGLDRRRPSEEA